MSKLLTSDGRHKCLKVNVGIEQRREICLASTARRRAFGPRRSASTRAHCELLWLFANLTRVRSGCWALPVIDLSPLLVFCSFRVSLMHRRCLMDHHIPSEQLEQHSE